MTHSCSAVLFFCGSTLRAAAWGTELLSDINHVQMDAPQIFCVTNKQAALSSGTSHLVHLWKCTRVHLLHHWKRALFVPSKIDSIATSCSLLKPSQWSRQHSGAVRSTVLSSLFFCCCFFFFFYIYSLQNHTEWDKPASQVVCNTNYSCKLSSQLISSLQIWQFYFSAWLASYRSAQDTSVHNWEML